MLVVLIIAALVALGVRDLLAAAAVLSVYSFFMALLFAELGAIDVAFVEATLGAGVTGVLLVIGLYHTRRRSED